MRPAPRAPQCRRLRPHLKHLLQITVAVTLDLTPERESGKSLTSCLHVHAAKLTTWVTLFSFGLFKLPESMERAMRHPTSTLADSTRESACRQDYYPVNMYGPNLFTCRATKEHCWNLCICSPNITATRSLLPQESFKLPMHGYARWSFTPVDLSHH